MQEHAEATTETTTAPAATPRTDRLELVKEMPRGSIGVVHHARSPQQNRSVALRKFEVPEWLDDASDLIKKIVTEARAASTIEHPNVARLYTCGYKDFTLFMTSEFIEGQTLRELMSKRQPEMGEVLQLAKQLCLALDAAHSKGVFHNFLNPYNIKVQADGTLKVLDFGLLRDKNLLSQSPAKKLENEPYLSPEQVKNKPTDRAANIFSAATILYEMYTARSPFHGRHLGEVDRSITDIDPHPMNMAHPRVPEAISRVILKALSKNPADRYISGQQLFSALEEAAKAEPVARANATGAHPAYPAGANPSASQAMKAMPSPSASQSFKAVSAASPSPAATPPSPGTTRVATTQTTARVQGTPANNYWKLVGGVVGGLCLIVGLAMIFRRPPAEVPSDNANANANVGASASASASASVPSAPQPDASADAPVSEEVETPTATRSSSTRTRRAARSVAVQPAAPAVSEGQLIVSSVPMGASVEIEGHPGQSWKAPLTIPSLAAGTYKVTFSMLGYGTETRTVQVLAGSRIPLDVRLKAVKGFITIAGSPAGAQVFINGKDTGKVTPVEFMVEPGVQSVVLRKSGYLESSTELKLVAGQSVSYSPSLMVAGRTDNIKLVSGGIGKVFGGGGSAQGAARIEIKSEPKGAQVIINGTALQKTTPVEIQVEAGNYDITIQKDGYQPVHENAIVGIEDRVKISRVLSR